MAGKNVTPKGQELVNNQQLGLFQSIIDAGYSNTIELYDAFPKFVHGKYTVINEHDLPPEQHVIERRFTLPVRAEDGTKSKQDFYLKITPATIIRKKAGKTIRCFAYPSYREMLVEDAIRKIAIEHGALLKDGKVGCRFSIRQIRRILENAGHAMPHHAVVEAINVMNKCTLEYGYVESDNKTRVSARSPLFPEVAFRTQDEYAEDNEALSFVSFHKLVNKGIASLNYRNYDFATCIRYKSGITSYLHKRLSQRFVQAAKDNSYRLGVVEFAISSGMNEDMPFKERVRTLKESLDELQENGVVASYETLPVPDPVDRRKRADVIFEIRVTEDFVSKTIKINGHSKRLIEGEVQ